MQSALSSPTLKSSFPLQVNPSIDPRELFNLKVKIGKGSFGKIWMATKTENENQKVAIKALPYEEGNDDLNTKLNWEIKVMINSRGCEHIVQYFGSYFLQRKKHKHLWIAMEYCENGSLRSYLNNVGAFKEEAVASILKQTLEGLAFMHKTTTTHRDLKSANILWNSDGEVKIADLGEALVLKENQNWGENMLTGTPYFMAPEVSTPERYSEKIDIWSLGVMAIELAEINPPFFNEPPFKIIFQVATQTLTPGLSKTANYSAEFRDFVSKCIQFEADDRSTSEQLLKHPFITKANSSQIKEIAKEYAANHAKKIPEKGCKDQNSSKGSITQVVYRDKITGQTLVEFFRSFILWKENNMEIIQSLCRAEVTQLALQKSDSRIKTFIKSLFKEDLQKKVERLSALIHVAWRASSPSFGVIIVDRQFLSTVYHNCFVGRELVDWIYHNLQLEQRKEAVHLANHLIDADLVYGINNSAKQNVDSELSYFRFQSSKIKDFHDSYAHSQAIMANEKLKRSSAEKEKPSDAEVVKMTQPTELTERDWSLIMSGANPQSFKLNDIIMQEGIFNRCIFRILEGKVRVEKTENGKVSVLSTMGEGQMFGEMSVLTQGKTSATIKADSTPCKVFITEVSFMYNLFQTEPGMQQRFFKRAAVSLAKKLRELGVQKKPIIELEESDSPLTAKRLEKASSLERASINADKKYTAIFGLPITEVVIQEFPCYLHILFKEHGQLYISSNYVCFYSKVFGKQTKIMVEIDDVSCEVSQKGVLALKQKKQKHKLHGLLDPYSVSSLISSLRDSRKASKEKMKITQSAFGEEEILSPDDWSLLLGESKCKTFSKDQPIVSEGEWAVRINQIAKGSCRVEKMLEKKVQVLGKMESGEIFGEISFLEGVRVTASVVAAEDNTEIYMIEGAALSVLFERQPALCGRFFRYLAQTLSSRLKNREQNQP